ncbi:MAG: aspartyl/asparaginyl beta-hydroxylase domain-containing protein [Balneolaceae bacterium]
MAEKKKKSRFIVRVGGKLLWAFEGLIKKASKVPTTPFLDPAQFEWTKELEDNWEVIRKEVDEILKQKDNIPSFQEISKDQKSITTDDKWKTFFLYGFGFKAEKNCEKCPETTRLIEQIPGMKTAFFSILSPGKHIPDHRGVYNGVMRYHLGIKVPEPKEKCRIRVHDQFAHWEEGKSMMFDDTYRHEVWNETDGVRVVLFMDIIRPLSFPVSALNNLLLNVVSKTSFIQDAKKNQESWEKKFDEQPKAENVAS